MERCKAFVFAVLAAGLSGCGASPVPSQPSGVPPSSAVVHTPWTGYPTAMTLMGVNLSGVVFESTAAGRVPVAGVSVYCDQCGEVGHTFVETDANGVFRFSGDIAAGGGVWVQSGFTTYVIATKDGYADPPGMPVSTWPGRPPAGWREATVAGDTQLDIQLVRR